MTLLRQFYTAEYWSQLFHSLMPSLFFMLSTASNILLIPNNLTIQDVENLLSNLLGSNLDDADLYFQHIQSESWILENGLIKNTSFETQQGVGVRAVSDQKTGYAYSESIDLKSLQEAIKAARSIVTRSSDIIVPFITKKSNIIFPILYPSLNPLQNFSAEDKTSLLYAAYEEAIKQDKRVKHVTISLNGSYEVVLIASPEYGIQADIRPLVRLNVNVVVAENELRESASFGGGGRLGYEYFLHDKALYFAREAVRIALVNLHASSAPAGNMPVVLGSGWPGILLHEAIGHGLEGDFNRKGTSIFAERIGQRVASDACTIFDQGNILSEQRGNLHFDDEGTPTQKTLLIENGILKGYMQDRLNARLMKQKCTGNGRRDSYASPPIPRMTNTYMLGGNYCKEEIISSVKKGLYAVNFQGGQVDITSGSFVFTTSEAYLIEHGKITYPVKNAALIGNGPEVLTKVSMVGNDLCFDPGIGTCGKDGQSVPVNVGQPTIKVDLLTVGGT